MSTKEIIAKSRNQVNTDFEVRSLYEGDDNNQEADQSKRWNLPYFFAGIFFWDIVSKI